MDSPSHDPHVWVKLLELSNLLPGHGVIRGDDREAGDFGLELSHELPQAVVFQTFNVLVKDAHVVPFLLEERAKETDTERVFAAASAWGCPTGVPPRGFSSADSFRIALQQEFVASCKEIINGSLVFVINVA